MFAENFGSEVTGNVGDVPTGPGVPEPDKEELEGKGDLYPVDMGAETMEGEVGELPDLDGEESETSVSIDEGAGEASPVEGEGPSPAPVGDGILDWEACWKNRQGHRKQGVVLNHFSFCRWGWNTATKLDGQGRVEGQVRFRETELGSGSNTARAGQINVKITDVTWTPNGVFNRSSKMTVRLKAQGGPGACTAAFDNGEDYTRPVGEWAGTYFAYDVKSPAASGDQKRIDKRAYCRFTASWRVRGASADSSWSQGPENVMRMDSAAYLGQYGKQGAIFNQVTPYLVYDYKSKAIEGVAKHLFTAFDYPQLTFPKKSPVKTFPGDIEKRGWKPLHRNYPRFNAASAKVTRDNRSGKDKACAAWVAKVTPPAGWQCDEYPFASTKEGAGLGDGNFSIRYVPRKENASAGAELVKWYGRDRILDGDAYGIMLKNRPNLQSADLGSFPCVELGICAP